MNHVYRVVFNATAGVWQAVSEIARGPAKSSSPARRLRRNAAHLAYAMGAALALPASAHAQLFWDGSQSVANGSVNGGAGIWDAANTNWTSSDGSANQQWNGGDAVFSGTANTIAVSGQQSVTGMEFRTDNTNLSGGTGGQINLVNRSGGYADLRVSPNVTATLGVAIGGSGVLDKLGAGTLVLNGNNSYTGSTVLSEGRLVVGSNTALGVGVLAVGNGILEAGRNVALANTVTLMGQLDVEGSAGLTLNGLISGGGSLVKNGPGTLTLTGANTYVGGTQLNAGTLAVGNNQALGSGSLTVSDAATLTAASQADLNNFVALNSNLTVTGNIDLGLNGMIYGSGQLTKNGSGTLSLGGPNNYSGGTALNSGTLSINNSNALGTGGLAANGAATLTNTQPVVLSNAIIVNGDLTLNTLGQMIYTGALSGSGTLRKAGSNELFLLGNSAFSGTVDVAQGTIHSLGGMALGNPTGVNVASGATLNLNSNTSFGSLSGGGTTSISIASVLAVGGTNADSNYAGSLQGNGALNKVGGGVLELSGNSTLGGGSQVSSGTLKVSGTFNGGGLTVASNSTLTGSGSIGGLVSVANGGRLAGTSGSTLTIGSLTLAPNANVNVALGSPAASNAALFNVAGTLTLDGFLNVTDAGALGNGAYRLFDYNALVNNALSIGNLPAGLSPGMVQVQTAIAGQVNLFINSPNTIVQLWDGSGVFPDGTVEGGSGVWNASNTNWTSINGTLQDTWLDQFAIFQGAAGTVTVDGAQTVNGMQFVTDGYRVVAGTGGELLTVNRNGGPFAIRVDPNVIATLDVPLNGTGNLQKLDTGTLVLNGANGYTGGTLLSGGTLVVGNNLALGPGVLTTAGSTALDSNQTVTLTNDVVANGQLNLPTSNALTLNGDISGSGGLNKFGASVLTLGGTNSFFGPVTLNAGTLVLSSANPLGMGALNAYYATQLQNSLALSLGNQINLTGDLTLLGGNALTLRGIVAGAGGLVKQGTGKLTLDGNNSFQGGVNLMGGNLGVGFATALGSGTLTVSNAASLDASSALALANKVQLDAALTVGGNNDLTLDGMVSGASQLIKNGATQLTLNGANNYAGGTTLNAGSLMLGNAAALGSGALNVAGASQLAATGAMNVGNAINIGNTLTVANNTELGFSGVLDGNGVLAKSGSGNLALSGNNTFSGGFDLQSGSITASGANALGQNATANVAGGANLFLTDSAGLSRLTGAGAVSIAAGKALALNVNGLSNTFSGDINGAGMLDKLGTGMLVLSGANNLIGTTTVSGGQLFVNGSLASARVQVNNGATLSGTGSMGGLVAVAAGGHLAVNSGSTLSIGALAMDANANLDTGLGAPVLFGGNALLRVGGDVTLDGKLNVSDIGGFGSGVYRLIDYTGTLTNNGITLGTVPGSVALGDLELQTVVNRQVNLVVTAAGTTVQFWDGAQSTPNGAIEGGSGTWSSNGANWTTVDGNVNRSWANSFAVFQGAAGTVTVAGTQNTTGMQFITDGYQLAQGALGSLNLVNGALGTATFRVAPDVTATLDVPLSGTGALGKYDTGTLVLNASSTYSGGTALYGGRLVLGHDKALGSGALTAADDTQLESNTAITLNNNVVLDGALTIGGSNAINLAGAVSGGGALIKSDAANLTLGGNNTYRGGTLVQAGGLTVASNTALGTGTLQIAGAATLDASQPVTLANNVILQAGLTVQGNQNLTLDGMISGAGSLTKNGASTLTLNGANTYTGGTYLNAGTLALGASSSLAATGIVDVASGATFDLSAAAGAQTFGTLTGSGTVTLGSGSLMLNNTTNGTFSGAIGGSGTLVKQGAGTQTLTGVNTYTGGTVVAGGALRAGSATALVQHTAYQVLTGATLDLNGHDLQASSLTGAGNVMLGTADLTVDTAANTVSDYAGKFQGSGNLIKTGAGALALNGASNFLGGVQLKQGRIDLGDAQGLGIGTLAMDDGTIINLVANGMTIANNLNMTGRNDPVIDTGPNSATWAGAISGAGFLTKQGTGILTLTSTLNSYTGATNVAQGTLRAGAANTFSSTSAHSVASGAVLDLAGYSQTLASLSNSGAVNLSGTGPGAVLKVTGPYVGNNGTLGVSTVLGADGSASDKLLLSGATAVASGSTSVQITNAGGLGAQTGSQGIEVIATENGGSLQPGSFTLAGGHVDAGAYEYRLTQTAQGAALVSSPTQQPGVTPTTPSTPTAPATPTPAYREEVPLLSALPAQLRQADMAMLGDMRKRMGDDVAQGAIDTDPAHRAWARVLRTAPTLTQQGTVNPESTGHLTGFQAGVDVYADRNLKAGLYVGQMEGDMSVRGFASGMDRKYAGYNKLRGRYLGVYGTWQHDSGLYADAVIQGADYRNNLRTADTGSGATTKGEGWLASLEIGKPIALGGSWKLEPQAQIIYRKLNLDDTTLSLAKVKNKADDDWTLRVGARVQGSYSVAGNVVQPFGRVNVYTASSTTDVASFSGSAGSTDIRAKGGYTSTELAVGAMLELGKNTSLYGDVGRLWANSGDSRVKSGVQGSVGLRVLW